MWRANIIGNTKEVIGRIDSLGGAQSSSSEAWFGGSRSLLLGNLCRGCFDLIPLMLKSGKQKGRKTKVSIVNEENKESLFSSCLGLA